MEYRYYEVPEKCPVLVLQGEKWLQNYGYQIDYLHFHNLMEIGFCYYGEGTIVLEDEELPYRWRYVYGGAEKLSAYNKLKRKQCMFLGMSCLWMWKDLLQSCIRAISRMAQKLIARINQKAHFVKNEDRPEVAELIKLIIKCMGEKRGILSRGSERTDAERF